MPAAVIENIISCDYYFTITFFINLLPFPGLDGWHLLVIAIEGIFRKEIPAKVKNVVSAVGVLILFALMILIVAKDIIGLF